MADSYSAADAEIAQAINRAQENLYGNSVRTVIGAVNLSSIAPFAPTSSLFMHWVSEVDEQIQRVASVTF